MQSRAHDAVAALGPASPDIGDDRRREIADYLLGQQSASRRAATREYLEDSADGRAWARAVAAALRPLAGDGGLPEIPAEPAEVDEAFEALDQPPARQEQVASAARVLGSRIFFGALGLLVAIGSSSSLRHPPQGRRRRRRRPRPSCAPRTTPPNEKPSGRRCRARCARRRARTPRPRPRRRSSPTSRRTSTSCSIAGKDSSPRRPGRPTGLALHGPPHRRCSSASRRPTVTSNGDAQRRRRPDARRRRSYREVLLTRERDREARKARQDRPARQRSSCRPPAATTGTDATTQTDATIARAARSRRPPAAPLLRVVADQRVHVVRREHRAPAEERRAR